VEVREESVEQLAVKAQAGCLRSFELLVDLTKERLFAFLINLLRNTHDAEDVAQETYVKVYRNLAKYDSRYKFVTWLYTIAKNTAASHHRKQKPAQPIDDLVETLPAPEVPESSAENIWPLARQLKPKFFEVLWLRYGEDFELDEVAKVMGTNVIYVKVLLHRARNDLAKRLRKAAK
jgi:RNA polymerase sigma-70 factor, ECF subfamily